MYGRFHSVAQRLLCGVEAPTPPAGAGRVGRPGQRSDPHHSDGNTGHLSRVRVQY